MEITTRFLWTKNLIANLCFSLNKSFGSHSKVLILSFFFLFSSVINAQQDVTAIYGDQGGYYVSSNVAQVTSDDSNNLIGFTSNGVTYSTGVDNSILTANGVVFTPVEFVAFPVPGNITYNSTELIGIAYNWDGNQQNDSPSDYIKTFDPIIPSFFIRDGISGLELGTNFFNIQAQDFVYDNLLINAVSGVNDGIPDLIATQTGAPSGSDVFKFVDDLGNTVGNAVSVGFGGVPIVGGMDWTIYEVDTSTGAVSGTFNNGINTYRDLRLLTFELNDFGITTANLSQATKFIHNTSGNTDIAFTAFNKNTLSFSPVDLAITSKIETPSDLCSTNSLDFVTTVYNNSGIDSNGFDVDMPIESGLNYVSSSAVFSSGIAVASYNSTTNLWSVSGLEAGESVVLTVNVSVSALSLPITYTNSISNMLQDDTSTSNNSISVSENDIDCDGIFDSSDIDNDNDGILDIVENSCDAKFTFNTGTAGWYSLNDNDLSKIASNPISNSTSTVTGNHGCTIDITGLANTNIAGLSPDATDYAVDSDIDTGLTYLRKSDLGGLNYGGLIGGTFSYDHYNYRAGYTGNPGWLTTGSGSAVNVYFYDTAGNFVNATRLLTSAELTNWENGVWNSILINIDDASFSGTLEDLTNVLSDLNEISIRVENIGSGHDGNCSDIEYFALDNVAFSSSLAACNNDTDNDGVPDYLDLDSDNDGIYDVDEAGNTALDTNNDGVIDSNDTGFGDVDNNGADDDAEITTPIDTLTDDSYDFQNTDSDGDGCTDANEAYGISSADGGDDGQFSVDPASVNPANGLVTETGVNYALGTNANVTDNLNSFACNGDDDGDGNPNSSDPNSNTPTAVDDSAFIGLNGPSTINILGNDDYLDNIDINNIGTTTITDTTTGTAGGAITFDSDTGILTYTPLLSEVGSVVTVIYEVCNDSNGVSICSIATVTITVEQDTDGDLIGDSTDIDSDNDGIIDAVECGFSTTPGLTLTGTNPDFILTDALGNIIDNTIASGGDYIPSELNIQNGNFLEIGYLINSAVTGDTFYSTETFNSGVSGIKVSLPTDRTKNSDVIIWTINWTGGNVGATGFVVDNNPRNGSQPNIYDPSSTSTTPVFSDSVLTNGYQFVLDDNGELYEATSPNLEGTNWINDFDFEITLPDGITSITITGTLNNDGTDHDYAREFIGVDFSDATFGPDCDLDTDNDGIPDYLDLDSDNDGIYDVDEAGNTALDTNNDGVIDANDADFSDSTNNGADDDAEITTPIDTLTDGSYDFQNTDSDGDGCTDANEAYVSAAASGSDGGQFGDSDPATVNPANGLVTETGVDYSLGTNSAVTDATNSFACSIIALEAVKTVALTTDVLPTGLSLGDTMTYTITVENTGNVSLDNIAIADTFVDANGNTLTLLTGPTFNSSDAGSAEGLLAVGETATYTATYVIEQAAIDAGGFSNSVLAEGDSPAGTTVDDTSDDDDDTDGNTEDDATVTTITASASIEAVKTVALTTDVLPSGLSLGDTMTYTITVENTGNVSLDNVSIADTFIDANGNTLTLLTGPTFNSSDAGSAEGLLAVGETATYTATYIIEQDAIDAGGFSNSVLAEGDSPAGTTVDDTSDDDDDADGNTEDDATVTTITALPSLEAVKTVAITTDVLPTGLSLGDTMTYTITVENTGNVSLDNVAIADTFVDANGNTLTLLTGPTFNSSDAGSAEGLLAVGETATYTATYVIEQAAIDAGGFSNSVLAEGDSPADTAVDDTSDDNDDTDGNTEDDATVTTITASASIEAVKTVALTTDVLPTGLSLGDTMTYTITVENTGNVSLDNVSIADTFVDANGNTLTLLTGPTFNSSDAGSAEGLLAVGETATYTATYVIEQDAIDAGGFSNSVLAEGDSPAGTTVDDTSDDNDDTDGNTEDDATVTTITALPSLEAVKTVAITTDVLPTGLSLGDTMTYTITVENTGNVSLDNVAITDTFEDANGNTLTLLTGPTFDSADAGSAEGLLAVGETATYTATYVIEQAAIDAGGFSNSVLAEGDSPAGTTVDDTSDDNDDTDGNTEDDATVTTITASASIEAVKTVALTTDILPTGLSLGDTMTYTITVENTGNVSLDNVAIADTFVDANGNTLTLLTGPTFSSSDAGSAEGLLAVGETATYTATYVIEQDAIDAGGFSNSVLAEGDSPAGITVDDTSDDNDDTDGNTEDDATVTTITASASIEAVKTVAISNDVLPTGLSLGDTMTYTITVENTGNVSLNNVAIADTFVDANGNTLTLLTGPTFNSSDAGSAEGLLAVGETATYTATYVIEQDAIDAGGFSNSVLAEGDSPAGTTVDDTSDDNDDADGNTEDDATVTTITASASIEAVKKVALTTDVLPTGLSLGDTMTYTITVENTGNLSLDNVAIADTFVDANGNTLTLLTGPTFNSSDAGSAEGLLAVGETATYTATYVIEQAAIDAGGFSNSVLAEGDSPAGTTVDDTSDDDDDADGNTEDDATVTTITASASIEAVKTVALTTDVLPTGLSLGDTMTYTITVENTGNVSLDNVAIADTFVDANGNTLTLLTGPTFNSSDAGSAEGLLAVGETATYTATYIIEQDAIDAGGFSNSVLAEGDSPAGTTVDDTSDDDDDADGNTEDDATVTTITASASIEAVKTVAITTDVLPTGLSLGDTMTYTITVENTGNVSLDNVAIADTFVDANGNTLTLLTGPTFNSSDAGSAEGLLAVGETATYTATYIIEQAAIDAGGFSNSVLAEGDSPAGTTVDDTSDDNDDTDGNTEDDATVTTITASASIEAVKTVAITTDVLPTGLSLGDTMTYTITVENTGNVSLDNVSIADTFIDANGNTLTLLTGPTFNSSDAGSAEGLLAVGETATYTATYIIEQDAIDAGGFSNSVLAEGDSPAGTTVDDTSDDDDDADGNTEDDATVTTITASASIEAVKTVAITTDVLPTGLSLGDTMTYTITVENTGNVSLDNVAIADTFVDANGNTLTLLTGPTFNSADAGSAEGLLAVGETATYTATYVIEQAAIDAGGFSNSVLAEGDSPAGTTVDDTSDDDDDADGNTEDDATVTTIAALPSLEAVKTVALTTDVLPTGLSLGDTMTYTITVENTGNVSLDNVAIADTFVDANGITLTLLTGPTFNSSDAGSAEGLLAVGETTTYTATYVIEQAAIDAGGFSNSVLAEGDSPAGTTVDDTSDDDDDADGNTEDDATVTTITASASIEAVKTVALTTDVLPTGLSLGDTMTYTITVENTGNVSLDNVAIADTFVDANGNTLTLLTGPTFSSSDAGSAEGLLAVGETATYTATYVIEQAAIDAGGFSNSVLAEGDSPAGVTIDDTSDDGDDNDGNIDNDATVTTITASPSIEAVKVVAISNDIAPTGLSLGDTMTYTITVENTGNVSLDNVVITDTFEDANGNTLTLLSEPTFDSADAGSSEGSLLVGETATYTATYVIQQDAIDAGGFSNSVLAEGDSPADTTVDDTSDDNDDNDGNTEDDATVTTLTASPSIEAVKTVIISNDVLPTGLSLGDTMTYTITVENTGNVSLDNVVITDTFEDANGNTLTLLSGPTFDSADAGSSEGSLLVGETATYTATYVIEQDAIDAGGFSNSVLAEGDSPTDTTVDDTSDDGDDNDGNTEDDATVSPITASPSLEAVKTVMISNDVLPTGSSLGDTMTYTIAVENTGNVSLDNVAITDTFEDANGNTLTLLTGPTFDSADAGSAEGSLLVGETATYTATYIIEQDAVDAGGFSNSVLAEGDSPTGVTIDDTSDDDDDNDGNTEDDATITPITASPSLEAVKTVAVSNDVLPTGLSLGDTMTYTITVENTGNVSLDNVAITDTFEDANGNTLTLLSGPTFDSADAGSLEGSLLVGETATYTATYVIEQDAIDAGGFSNSVFAEGDSPAGVTIDDTSDDGDDNDGNIDNDATVTTIVSNPSINLIKTTLDLEDTNGDGISGSLGDLISYVFTVENTGNVTLTDIVVQDNLPGLNLLGGPIAQLIPGEIDTTTFTATYEITQADLDAGNVINSATVISEGPRGDLIDPSDDITDTSDDPNNLDDIDDNNDDNPDDPTVTPVNSFFDIEVTKVVDVLEPVIGSYVTFTIEVANIGNVTATDVIINEQIPSGYVFVSYISTSGVYSDFDDQWVIGQLDPDQVEIFEVTVEVLGFGDYLNVAYVENALGGEDTNTFNDEASAEVDPICLTIYNEFSPDGNGVNDTFVIDCIERYPNNKLEVYNRWGNIVYSKKGYLNNWEGKSNGRTVINESNDLPVGTYYYVLDLGNGIDPLVGWLYINRLN
ncbi:gliding motility-associated C-terminal domain-containing protein [Winogradskyella sp. HaHa_3_26]|uniref:DUF7507 domain-containing protein n=1 Tax=Winogradskyella sp. HaHa_3_26 TaxID=2749995 RepID=UPI001C4FB9C4|nr:gliding motility-associated C-terminal domain-containing protein [Winogradskyella sp. HaHa_3_26]QXP79699.1 DUF11 domain-containing protein [Winogradskyella sp. HaHa_3_26]